MDRGQLAKRAGDVMSEILPFAKGLKDYARQLRQSMTESEQNLWNRIRRKQICRTQFYRQKPIGPYILDFYSKHPKLAIELDGKHHYLSEQREYDIERDTYLSGYDIKVVRFSNFEVLNDIDGVLKKISKVILSLRNA